MNVNKHQITLTPNETAILAANPLGLSVPEYIKFVARQAAVSVNQNVPTFRVSKKLEKVLEQGIKDYEQGKAKFLYNI